MATVHAMGKAVETMTACPCPNCEPFAECVCDIKVRWAINEQIRDEQGVVNSYDNRLYCREHACWVE